MQKFLMMVGVAVLVLGMTSTSIASKHVLDCDPKPCLVDAPDSGE